MINELHELYNMACQLEFKMEQCKAHNYTYLSQSYSKLLRVVNEKIKTLEYNIFSGGNEHSPLLIVSPLTSRDKKYMPTHALIHPTRENGLTVKSTVLTEQIITLNKTSVKKILGCLSDYDLRKVNRAVQISLAL